MPQGPLIADDLRIGLGPVTVELLGEDTPENQRKVHYLYERGLKGLFKVGDRTIACIPSVVRAELARRAGLTNPAAPQP
jgi:hypothetical protein